MTAPVEEVALYRVFGADDLLLYVGISNEFGRRWKEHAKTKPWWLERRRLTVDEWFSSRQDAEAAEIAAIRTENPKYNLRRHRLHLVASEVPDEAVPERQISMSPDMAEWLAVHYEVHGCSIFGCGCGCRFPAMDTPEYHELRASSRGRSR